MSYVNVPVVRDDIAEGLEQFDLVLTVPSSLSPAITGGGRDTAVGVITDSTSECVIMYMCSISYVSIMST